MSYSVTASSIMPWFKNAFDNAWNKHFNAVMAKDDIKSFDRIGDRCWAREYSSTLVVFNSDVCKIAFKDEQEYIMFILRWS